MEVTAGCAQRAWAPGGGADTGGARAVSGSVQPTEGGGTRQGWSWLEGQSVGISTGSCVLSCPSLLNASHVWSMSGLQAMPLGARPNPAGYVFDCPYPHEPRA